MTKICGKCKQEKPCSSFALNRTKPTGLQSYCRECKKACDAKHYKQPGIKEKQKLRNRTNERKNKVILNKIKVNISCIVCSENDTCCLDFHHCDIKFDNISNLINRSPRKAFEEILKCVVICSSCHRKLHAGRFKLNEIKIVEQKKLIQNSMKTFKKLE